MTGDGGEDQDSSTDDSFLRAVARAPDRAIASSSSVTALASGEVIAGRFRLEQRLGEGGMGVVWAARHVVTRKPVALKFIKNTSRGLKETRQRFLREARAACAVRHPSVVEVHDVLELQDGSPVMVMDLLEGESFAARLAREPAITVAEVAQIMVPVCAALGTAHAVGIVHRDLKPDNIFLAAQPDGTTSVKVLDFGIAKLTATEGDAAHTGATTGTGTLLGTPFYMAPEQMFGEKDIDHRADLWAIGVILYEALAGQRPTQGANVGQIFKLVTRDGIVPLRTLAPSLPEQILALVSALLEQDRDRRPADLRHVVRVLADYTSTIPEPFGVPRPVRAVSAITPVSAPPMNVDSDDAHAPTVDASASLRTAQGWPRWAAIGAVGATIVAVSASALRGLDEGKPIAGPGGSVSVPPGPAVAVSAAAVTALKVEAVETDAGTSTPASLVASERSTGSSVRRPPAPPVRAARAAASASALAVPSGTAPKPAVTTPKMSEDL